MTRPAPDVSKIRFALHGGAGDLPDAAGDQFAQRQALAAITDEAHRVLLAGGSALDAVTLAVERLEDCPLFNAGIGAVLNRDGLPELDAAVMCGEDRAAGAVAGVSRVRHPVRLARAVMERTPHLLFAGVGAEALAVSLGLETTEPETFITEQRRAQLAAAQASGAIALDHDAAFGTVGAVARDALGRLAAATSTGGLSNKLPGRVGDSPLIGAGTWADARSAAISCTGTGEAFIRAGFGYAVHAAMTHSRLPLADACDEALAEVASFGGRGGCIAIAHDGTLALPFNTNSMYRAWIDANGALRVAIGAD